MISRKKVTIKLFFIFFLASIWSCSEEFSQIIKEQNSKENLVTLEHAIGFASVLEFPAPSYKGSPNGRSNDADPPIAYKTVNTSFSVLDINEQPALHIVNYEEGGYVVISGDNRMSSIQAYVENGSLTLETKELPDGLIMWLAETTELVAKTRENPNQGNDAIVQSFEPCETRALTLLNSDPCPEDCLRNNFSKVDPLLSTTWGQGVGYNNEAPNLGCTDYSNWRAPAGCVATAVAQVMKYHEYPNTYYWAGMPNTVGGSLTSLLMRDIGNSVGMDYGCSGSGVKTKKVVDIFKDVYGYQSASYADFQFHTVKQNLNTGRPVILAAKRVENCFLVWCIATKGHAWVVDGYIENEVWDYYCETGTITVSLHMNWGWNGTHNGWFSYSNWNPGGTSYIYNKEMLYNIQP